MMELSKNKEINFIFWIISVLVFFLPIIYNPWGYDRYAGFRLIFLFASAILIVFVYLSLTLRTNRVYYKKHQILIFISLFLLTAFVSALASNDKFVSFWGSYQRYEGFLAYVVYFILFYVGFLFFNKTDLKKFLTLISLGALLITAIGLAEPILLFIRHQPVTERISSTLGNPSYLGAYLVLVFPLAFSLLRSKTTIKLKIFLSVILVFIFTAIIFTFSRGAWLGLLSSLLVLAALNAKKIINYFQKNVPILIYAILGMGIIGLLLWYSPLGRELGRRFVSISNFSQGTVRGRIDIWRQILYLIKYNFWLGVGPDNLLNNLPRYYFLPEWSEFGAIHVDKAHNEFLQIWATMGIFGLIFYIGIITSFLKDVFGSLKKLDDGRRVLLEGIVASFIGYLVTLMFHFSSIEITPIFWLMVGMGVGLSMDTRLVIFSFKGMAFLEKLTLKLFFLILFILFSWYSIRIILADYHFQKGLVYLDKQEKEVAQAQLTTAIAYNPRIYFYHLVLANSLQDNNPQKALEVINYGIAKNPFEARLWLQRADIYLVNAEKEKNLSSKLENYKQAKANLDKVLKLYPIFAEGHLKLGIIYMAEGESEKGVSEWLRAIELNPEYGLAYYNLGLLYEKSGDKQKAIEFLNKVPTTDPIYNQAKEKLQTISLN